MKKGAQEATATFDKKSVKARHPKRLCKHATQKASLVRESMRSELECDATHGACEVQCEKTPIVLLGAVSAKQPRIPKKKKKPWPVAKTLESQRRV